MNLEFFLHIDYFMNLRRLLIIVVYGTRNGKPRKKYNSKEKVSSQTLLTLFLFYSKSAISKIICLDCSQERHGSVMDFP